MRVDKLCFIFCRAGAALSATQQVSEQQLTYGEVGPPPIKAAPQRGSIPTKLEYHDLDQFAWLGDVWLTMCLRLTCVTRHSVVDQRWCETILSNANLRRFLTDDGWIVPDSLSDHGAGQSAEFLFCRDSDFRRRFCTAHGLVEAHTGLADLTPYGAEAGRDVDQCWRRLFRGPVTGHYSFPLEKWMSRAQLEEVAGQNALSSGSFGLEVDGTNWHLVDGSMSAREVLASLTKRARLGGRESDADSHPFKPFSSFPAGLPTPPNSREGTPPSQAEPASDVPPEVPVASLPGPEPVRPGPLAGCAPSTQENLCWSELFPECEGEYMTLKELRRLLTARFKALKETDNKLAWSFVELWSPEDLGGGDVWHVAKPDFKARSDRHVPLVKAINRITLFGKAGGDLSARVGLTVAVVLGTVGDVEPTLDVVAANHFAAKTQEVDPTPVHQQFSFVERGAGWCASDFLRICPEFARAMDDKHQAKKGELTVSTPLWNLVCEAWGGEPIAVVQEGNPVPGAFPQEGDGVWNCVPARPVGEHERVMPEDFVLVTHPDHIDRYAHMGWEARSVGVDSKSFIKLGQDILEHRVYGLRHVKQMQRELLQAVKCTLPIVEQADLVYLVSGTTYHYFIGSLFPDKQVFEVCPVPREDNGTCPEFYLGHYAKMFSEDPRFGFEVGRLYNQVLTTPTYLNELEWSGTYRYREPPKFNSVMPWAAERWKLSSPNIGFKPYTDFVAKKVFRERPRIKAYLSFGSCETLTDATREAIEWLRSLPVDWTVDQRWLRVLEGTVVEEAPFFCHATGLAEFDWVVHHGGSGVTNTCLAVGVPQTILPQIGDQFIWEESLRAHCVPPLLPEGKLRALLFEDRFPPQVAPVPPDILGSFTDFCVEQGVTFHVPWWLSLKCCHDWNEYGYKDLDLVVGELGPYWITLYDTRMQREGVPGPLELKWVHKEHVAVGPPIVGWRGVPITATYPEHAHGWFGWFREVEGLRTDFQMPEGWAEWFIAQCRTGKHIANPTRSQRPAVGSCHLCKRERELTTGVCGRCMGEEIRSAALEGLPPRFLFSTKWTGNRPKGRLKCVTQGRTSGFAVRSTRRYFQLDSRAVEAGECRAVARALLDRVRDWDDLTWVEAYWHYTHSAPPHYTFRTRVSWAIEQMKNLHEGVSVAGLASDVVSALGSVLSLGSAGAIIRRVVGRNALTTQGRSVMWAKWHVVIDALRHFDTMGKEFGINLFPDLALSTFPVLPEAAATAFVSYKGLVANPLRNRVASSRWLEALQPEGSPLKVHLFSIKLPALGPRFGVFHAVVEWDGKFWELQQVAGERTLINVTRWAPEASPDRPLVKSIVVTQPVTEHLSENLIRREFSGLDYKILGDNCLAFANFMCFSLTGHVIPWRHFGAFGAPLPLGVGDAAREWVGSHFWRSPGEERLSVSQVARRFRPWDLNGRITEAAADPFWVGPRRLVRDYGLAALRRVDALIEHWDRGGPEDAPWHRDSLLDLAILGYKNFGLSSHLVSQALLATRVRRIPVRRRKLKVLLQLHAILRELPSLRLAQDAADVLAACGTVRQALRGGTKPAWAPLVSISVPRHWFRDRNTLVEVRHDPENIELGTKRVVQLDLPQIVKAYGNIFPQVDFGRIGFRLIKPGEYEIGVKVPARTKLPVMDDLSARLIQDLQEMHPFELGVFSLRFGTLEMAEKVTDRYFTGSFDAGTLIPEEEQQELAEAIFRNESHLYQDAQLLNPEEVWRKWKKAYSAGFPFRFSRGGKASRDDLVRACGGKKAFLEGVRRYIASPEAFPTVSHAFIKDEVLPESYIEREKIRTIIAQDPLNYYLSMAVQGDQAKRLDPLSFSAVGVSPAHGEMSALAERHLAYKHHFAMDITAMDSTAAVDCVGVIKRLRKLGFKHHPQRVAVESAIDATYDNLVASWIVDIHTGRARFKRQGLTTGHATTTSSNTDYMRALMLYAWKQVTGRTYDEFYQDVKFTAFSDDNFWSTSLDPSVWSADKISEFWLSRGVQVRVEGASDDLSNLSFLAKRFSFDPHHLDEVRMHSGRDARVAIVHDINRLLQKFSDYKKKNTLEYRWEKLCALQLNCAHHQDVYEKVGEYLNALEKEMNKRKYLRKVMRQKPRKTYHEVMQMMYSPGKHQKSGLLVTSLDQPLLHKLDLWWQTFKVDVMTFDSTANTYGRIMQQFAGLLEIGGLTPDDPGVFLRTPGEYPKDPEMTLEHHCYLLGGCPETFEAFQMKLAKTPFAAFTDAAKFWALRDSFDLSEAMENSLRAKVLMLNGVYTIVAWLERALGTLPVIGPMYRLFCTAKGMSERAYSRINSLYWAMFGESSLVLSAMMPKDHYLSLKVLAIRIWTKLTSTDLFEIEGDLASLRGLADSMCKLAQDVHNLAFELDFSAVVPQPGGGERHHDETERAWNALDHSAQVATVRDLLAEGRSPMITGPTGCGKSTDFVVNLWRGGYNTVIVACPRRILVRENPVAAVRLWAGCPDVLTPGLINFGTAGYLRRVLGELPDDALLVLDEFHELDEDTVWLWDKYQGQTIVMSATPEFPGAERMTPVALQRSRSGGHVTTTYIKDTAGKLQDAWDELLAPSPTPGPTLVVLPTVADVEWMAHHALALAPGKRFCVLHRGRDTVTEADWYFATSIVDAGLTIPGLTRVIDTGWSSGWSQGKFRRRPSSHNVADQRRGRTGRTCDGSYVRLISRYDDTPWDFSTPFLCNNRHVAWRWKPGLQLPKVREKGVLEGLPGGYAPLMAAGDWSSLIYLCLLYENRLDVQRTRAAYQSARKYPDAPSNIFLMRPVENRIIQDLHLVEGRLSGYRIPNTGGNAWNWDCSEVVLVDFSLPVPAHLRDLE